MRTVVLTHNDERHYYVANRLVNELEGQTLVITGGKYGPPDKIRPWSDPAKYSAKLESLLFRPYVLRFRHEKKDTEERRFGGSCHKFKSKNIESHLAEVGPPHKDINDPYYVKLIKDQRPDLIVVFGTRLIREGIIKSAPMVLNLHTGLSPYYRGGYTNLWPIVLGEYGYFGFTVHMLDLGIDSGNIIYTRRITVEEKDSFFEINCRAIQQGAEYLVKAARDYYAGRLESRNQWISGKVFHNRHFKPRTTFRYYSKVSGYMQQHLQLQREKRLEQVELVG